jgi:galacturan 1,4-alpha-galacturonidase
MYWLRNLLPLTICSTALAAAASKGGVSYKGNVCTVTALGGKRDDVPNILEAFSRCGKDGTIVFPEDQNYWIATRLNPVVSNVVIDWRGVWTVCDSIRSMRRFPY